ncbi:MAG: GtrA family protein [Raoultibacter sp.]
MVDYKSIKQQGIKYLLIGGSSAALELCLFQLLYALFGWPVAFSNISALVVATTFNFLMNRTYAFKSSSNPAKSVVLYLILFTFNTVFSTITISLLIDAGLMSIIAKLITMVCITLWNFILYRKVVFA